MTVADLSAVRALICEDEPLAIRALREYLSTVPWIEIAGEARSGPEAMRLIHKLEPDLVFMDIRMPGLTGIQVVEMVSHRPAVVFTTAYDEFALNAFELGAVDYLVKPFGRERLLETLSRVRVRLVGEGALGEDGAGAGRHRMRIFARSRGAIVPVPTGDIIRIDAVPSGSYVRTSGAVLELDMTLTELMEKLDPADFVRVHRAHAVNLSRVTSIRRYDDRRLTLTLSDGSTLVASRRGSRILRTLLG